MVLDSLYIVIFLTAHHWHIRDYILIRWEICDENDTYLF